MNEVTFLSYKGRKETFKYLFVILFAVITWILQLGVFGNFFYFDTTPSLILLGIVYFGLIFGQTYGTIFGIICAFFSSSTLYDHMFCFSFPLIGFLAGFCTKNLFSDELLLFIILSFLFTLPLEYLNGWQFSLENSINITTHYLSVSLNGAILNLFFAPFYYILLQYITKKLKLR